MLRYLHRSRRSRRRRIIVVALLLVWLTRLSVRRHLIAIVLLRTLE